ncbi:CarD family transcriptional regulator [Siminovitchia sp. 179-K 8D1 HS]|uniref:CarD family transcriptional regulator n=1 Tax=Siminovitchia sp. 179-K 8D1 HS TaxID=3142385 RepID=UPI0039A041D1
MFNVDDKVFYPMHGAGVILSIEEKNFFGQKETYYIISIPTSKMDVMIPKKKAAAAGIRSITDRETANEVLSTLHDSGTDFKLPWKQRYNLNMEKVKTGTFYATAEVIHDLICQGSEKVLNGSEKQLLNEAKKLIISELALIKGVNEAQAAKLLKQIS